MIIKKVKRDNKILETRARCQLILDYGRLPIEIAELVVGIMQYIDEFEHVTERQACAINNIRNNQIYNEGWPQMGGTFDDEMLMYD